MPMQIKRNQAMQTLNAARYSMFESVSVFLATDQNKDIVAPHHKYIRHIWRNQYAVFHLYSMYFFYIYWWCFHSLFSWFIRVVVCSTSAVHIPVSVNRPTIKLCIGCAIINLFRNPHVEKLNRIADKKKTIYRGRHELQGEKTIILRSVYLK